MENQQQPLQKTDNIIGVRKYEFLKSIPENQLSEFQRTQIEIYDSKSRSATPEQIKKQHEYFDKILEEKKELVFSVTAKDLYNEFRKRFESVTKSKFERIEGVTIKNLEPLIYYFSKDQRFFECENLSKISDPSFEKGLLIIGTFGNGKTATMKVFENIFKAVPGFAFKGYSANESVLMFEKCTGDHADEMRAEFEKAMYRGRRYFDDIKTERIASNYGKVNIFKEILEERYNRKEPTYITCNYKDGHEGNIEAAIDEFGEKYGARMFDRVFEMFNVIEFKGKSFRK